MGRMTLLGAGLGAAASAALGPGGIATTNVKLWLDADSLGLADTAAVSSFTDSGPLGNHAVQATGSLQPTYRTAILNGKACVRFDATDDRVRVPALDMTDTASCMVFTVFTAPSGGSRMVYEMTDGDANSTVGTIQGFRRSDDFIRMNLRGNGGASAPQLVDTDHSYATTARYLTATYNFAAAAGSEITGRYNGTAIVGTVVNGGTNNTDTAFTSQPLNIGNRGSGGLASGMDLFELIILKGTDITERNTVESYLATKYGL